MTWDLLASLLVKSGLVAGAGMAAARWLAQRPADRADILRATVCLLLALPMIMNALPALDLALLPPAPDAPTMVLVPAGGEGEAIAVPLAPFPPPGGLVLGGLWLIGAMAVGIRLILGLRTLDRWSRAGQPVTCQTWLEPLERLPLADRPELVASDRVAGPLSWGVAPGCIILDPATLAQREAAPAVMAHELAHLRRHDWIFLVLSRMALALFWFNPLVWRLHAALAERSEEAADALALETVDRAAYARTLVRMAAQPATHAFPKAFPKTVRSAATAMAADSRTLKTRIAHIMTETSARRRPLTVGLAVAALAAVATPLAALGVTRQPAETPAPATTTGVIVTDATPSAPPSPPEAPVPPAEVAAAPLPPVPPAPPALAEGHYTFVRVATAADREIMAQARVEAQAARVAAQAARAEAVEARAQAIEARAQAEEVRHAAQVEARAEARADARAAAAVASRAAASARVQADQARIEADRARIEGERARRQGELAQIEGERARQMGERARVEAERHMARARVDMARGAEQMRQGAKDMRAEAVRLRDPAYRAKQIAENRMRGNEVTDAELRALADRLPGQADDLERQADRLAERARERT